MSFTGPYDPLIEKAVARMRARGVVFVAAAGNEGPTSGATYPAAYRDVIAVTAVDKHNANYPMANRGDFIDLSAPGVRIWTALPGGKEGFRSGTSFATPFVTGLLAAMPKRISGKVSEAERLRSLRTVDLGPPGTDPIFGRGLAVSGGACGGRVAAAPPPERPRPSPQAASAATTAADTATFGTMTIIQVPAAAAAFGP